MGYDGTFVDKKGTRNQYIIHENYNILDTEKFLYKKDVKILGLIDQMANYISSLNFSKLISHVFPGFLFIFSIFMLMDSFCATPGTYTYKIFESKNLEMFIGILGVFLILGTIIGLIIDAIQHIIISEYFENTYSKYEQREKIEDIYKIIDSILLDKFIEEYKIDNDKKTNLNELDENGILSVNFYYPLIDSEKLYYFKDNFYYYYEFYANVFLVLIFSTPTVFFYTHEALKLPFTHSFYLTSVIFVTSIICLYAAWTTFKTCKLINLNLILGSLVEKAINKKT